MNWISLNAETQVNEIVEKSFAKTQVIFKHSTRCSISSIVLTRLEKSTAPDDVDFHYLDLIAYRPVSNLVSDIFKVHHESPQILIIKNGECIFDESHMAIHMNEIAEQAAQ